MLALKIVLLIIGSYFMGNINFAVIISKFKLKKDIRTLGSGNPGTVNMLRNFGTKLAILTLVLDAVKGIIPALVGWYLLDDRLGVYIAGLSTILGHMFPVLMKFKGGKGVATSIGIFLVSELWWIGLIAFAIAVLYAVFFHYGFIASMIILYTMTIMEIFLVKIFPAQVSNLSEIARIVLIAAITVLITFAHRKNIVRLIKGKESKIYAFGIGKPKTETIPSTLSEEEKETTESNIAERNE